MSALDSQMAYCAWRLKMFCESHDLTYRDIDDAVFRGGVKIGSSLEEVRAGLKAYRDKQFSSVCHHDFHPYYGHCVKCGYPGR